MKKKEGLSRLLEIAGEKKSLLLFSGLFSAISALCILIPFWSIYEILKELLVHASDLSTTLITQHYYKLNFLST
ncbi:hypothetical protein [Bacteroides caccae]|uniref:hypothetical protein n=1 Tax=Bacteroides caccae TaxID=47678 RepID=UPI0034A3AD18